jgi:hypothetical protein
MVGPLKTFHTLTSVEKWLFLFFYIPTGVGR